MPLHEVGAARGAALSVATYTQGDKMEEKRASATDRGVTEREGTKAGITND